MSLFDPVRRTLRAFAAAVTPETESLDEQSWREVEEVMLRALAPRPPRVRRQIVLLLRVLEQLPRLKKGRGFSALAVAERSAFVEALEHARLQTLRRGIWGLRTLVFMGYYTRPDVMQQIGYRANARGWGAHAP